MQFLRSVLGAGVADKEIPYKPGEPYREAWGAWTHSPGTSKEDNSAVSIFSLTGTNGQDAHLAPARNGAKRLRTVRHPNILTFQFSTEIEREEGGVMKPTVYIVTEAVMPLSEKIKELDLTGVQRDEYFAWGLHQIAKAANFLNNDCKLVHGNICVASVVVTPSLDWKLHALDVLSEFDGGNADAQGPMLPFEWMVAPQYKPMEVSKSDWTAVRRGPPHAIDAWGLGCLIQELFSNSKLTRTEELRSTSSIPKMLLPDYQRLLGSVPNRRMNPSKLIENSEFFQNKLVSTIQFMEVLNIKDTAEKDTFFRKLPTLIEQLPREIVLKKILPQLSNSLEFGAAPAPALTAFLKMGGWLSAADFATRVLPTVVKLFASQDRAIRVGLLQNIEAFGNVLSADVVDGQVFGHVSTGFSDSSAFIRELTLKAMLVLCPKLSSRTLTGPLLKHLSKLQVDEEPAIRTNTTILLGNMARHLNDATRKRVLVNAFTVRALRDGFPPARSAGVMALMATSEYYDHVEMATRILPAVVVLMVDPDADVRSKAFQGSELFLAKVKEHYAKVSSDDLSLSSNTAAPPVAQSTAGLLGWAVSSLTSKGPPPAAIGGKPPGAPPVFTASAPPASMPADVAAAVPLTGLATPPSHPPPANHLFSPGWATAGNDSNGHGAAAEEEEEAEGWGELKEDLTGPLSRLQTAQQRPMAAVQTKKPMGRGLGGATCGGASGRGGGGVSVEERATNERETGGKEGWGDGEDEDPWESIAAPKPMTSVRPLSAKSSSVQKSMAQKSAVGERRAPVGAQHVSLESVLGNSMKAGGGVGGVGRGRAKPSVSKLGAQRVGQPKP